MRQGADRRARSVAGSANRLGDWIIGNGVHQSQTQGLRCVDFFGCYEHRQSESFADQSRQTLSSSPACDQTQSRASMSEDSVERRNPMMARQR